MIPYGRQDISDADVQAVVEVLKSDWLTQGPSIPAFEQAVADRCNAAHAVAVSNATGALHIACLALGVGPGDIVWTAPNTFVASANCALYCGADVDFVDIDARTYNMSINALREKLIKAKIAGRLPKVVIPVHFAGQSCDMREMRELADTYDFSIIEDASHAIGGRYLDGAVGNCRYSDITVFSFHPVKIITTAEGGMALTNDVSLDQRLRLFRSHGVTRDTALMHGDSEGPWYYQQVELGYNYRMTDIQAALGLTQLTRLDEFCERRRQIAARYDAAFEGVSIVPPWQSPDTSSALHLYPILCAQGTNRRGMFDALRAAGIGVNVHYFPVHLQPYYQKFGFKRGDFPEAENYYARTISLPMYASMSDESVQRVIDAVVTVAQG
ncbi:UDP-4-amino-4,6-dideoxy-N-acetyl-beta-L-altrosamine transaminase [Herbaspirillum sp. meg3]|uniref:UDP-4-amino-4, 6-dideoxy-N-acetyl-beta-L-altrosamine transaminase n=1 Tax=Herbaspirillum sp. meg3 TaxID=2025949 RepID=UPI000B98CA82|nr:UDP-4-amino-4,6-dideoxy-N-acetyl-beta-L-altrosamine transaminase [Herbaspirillum sp. meg3]ASU40583.1 UDP-4-amino-4,6-dideoxy-N-acetyl-beta-L-altrosamine transaminase [Herbaspirillum sp. meg3]